MGRLGAAVLGVPGAHVVLYSCFNHALHRWSCNVLIRSLRRKNPVLLEYGAVLFSLCCPRSFKANCISAFGGARFWQMQMPHRWLCCFVTLCLHRVPGQCMNLCTNRKIFPYFSQQVRLNSRSPLWFLGVQGTAGQGCRGAARWRRCPGTDLMPGLCHPAAPGAVPAPSPVLSINVVLQAPATEGLFLVFVALWEQTQTSVLPVLKLPPPIRTRTGFGTGSNFTSTKPFYQAAEKGAFRRWFGFFFFFPKEAINTFFFFLIAVLCGLNLKMLRLLQLGMH